jgi:hypothetical protein
MQAENQMLDVCFPPAKALRHDAFLAIFLPFRHLRAIFAP